MSAEIYDRVRALIQHESDLINHRLSWLIGAQSFLFVAYSTILVWAPTDLKIPESPANPQFTKPTRAMFECLPRVGIVSSALQCTAIIAAIINTELLIRLKSEYKLDDKQLSPRIAGNRRT